MIYFYYLIVLSILPTLFAGATASWKGHNVVGWIIDALFLSWIAVIILAVLPAESSPYYSSEPFYTQQKRENSKNRCSNCGAEVKNGVCTFCKKGNTLTLPPKPNPSVKKVTPFRCKECGETINTSICPYCGSKY